MKIFARMVVVFALLCGLAYGSFAFGKYVLSNKLFGDTVAGGALRTVSRSTSEASAVTRHTNWKGSKPRVEVRMLPADEAGPAPQTSALADEDNLSTERRNNDDSTTSSSSSSENSKDRHFDDVLDDDDSSDVRKAPRSHRRRRHSSEKKATPATTSTPAADAAKISTPDTDSGDEEAADSAQSDTSPTKKSATSTPPRLRARRARETSKPRTESPVPQPENAGTPADKSGGDSAEISPVPQPE
jgi:hypothetical protein